jgi:hypothetical protein
VCDAREMVQMKVINRAVRRRIREPFSDVKLKIDRGGLYRKSGGGW